MSWNAFEDPLKWRLSVQRGYSAARRHANELLKTTMNERADAHNAQVRDPQIKAGDQVWLYINRVKPGYARKLTHLWHGPFRVAEMVEDAVARLETRGTDYSFFPLVHVGRLKLKRTFPERPSLEIANTDSRFDFDEALLPEDSWAPNESSGLFEIEEIVGHRELKRKRQGRRRVEYQVRWKGYDELSWIAYDYFRRRRSANRYATMQIKGGEESDQE